MNDNLTMASELSEEDWQTLRMHFSEFNVRQSDGLSQEPGVHIQLALRDKGGEIRGALSGRAIYKSLLIDIVWIEETHRGRGHGRALVSEAERIAQSNGCISAQTSSYSFQAPEFYQALGYEVFGEFDGYPDGIKKYYLGKTL